MMMKDPSLGSETPGAKSNTQGAAMPILQDRDVSRCRRVLTERAADYV